jgi:uncharacterized protein
MSRPIPIGDALTEPYWNALAQGRFLLPRCESCARFHFYPRPACPYCRSASIAWVPASGRGCVHSYSIVHRAPNPAFADDVPYPIAIVKTDEGPQLMSRIVRIDAEAVRIGLRVRVRIEAVADGVGLPFFEPDGDDAQRSQV